MGIKINLCCEKQILDGWINCDERAYLDDRIVRWQWGEILPCETGKAEIVHVSYGFMYADKELYPALLTQIKRALKRRGRLVIKEDDDRLRVWKKPGTVHSSGTIKSTSNEDEMKRLLEEAGFRVIDGYLEEDTGILDTHRKARSRSYVLTGFKK